MWASHWTSERAKRSNESWFLLYHASDDADLKMNEWTLGSVIYKSILVLSTTQQNTVIVVYEELHKFKVLTSNFTKS